MPSSLVLTAVLATLPVSLGEGPGKGMELVERILAVVDERPLLLSEVRLLETVRGLARSEALEAAIDERLMYQEAARLPQAEVSAAEEEEALGRLLEERPELEEQIPLPRLRRLVRRQATIVKYVEFRFRPQVRITEAELRRVWEEAGGGKETTFEESALSLRARLERDALDRRIEDWVEDLRRRAELRYVEGPGSPPPPPDATGP